MLNLIILLGYFLPYAFCDLPQGVPISSTTAFQPRLTDTLFPWTDGKLYYTDFLATSDQPSIFSYDPATDKTNSANIPGYTRISYMVAVECDTCAPACNRGQFFMSGSGHNHVVYSWNGVDKNATFCKILGTTETNDPSSHLDAGFQNAEGEFFFGTTQNAYCGETTPLGSFYQLESSGVSEVVTTDLFSTGGVAFGPDGQIYQADVCSSFINEFTFSNGAYTSKVLINLQELGYNTPGYVATDTDGNIYIPMYNNGTLLQYLQSTGETQPIALLPPGATTVNFGGANLDTLYVVVSSVLLNPKTLQVTGVDPGAALYTIPSSATGNVNGQINAAFNAS